MYTFCLLCSSELKKKISIEISGRGEEVVRSKISDNARHNYSSYFLIYHQRLRFMRAHFNKKKLLGFEL